MSFIKKAVKKVVSFVKKYWKEIVMVAAVVFTAGIATVGVAGFSAAMAAGGGGVGGFLSAVGSTMWAGVTATAGSLGIGSGAAVGAGTPFASAGIAGGASHVGLGAAMGAGGGYGFGAAGKTAAQQAAAKAAQFGTTPSPLMSNIGTPAAKEGVGSIGYDAAKKGLTLTGGGGAGAGAGEGGMSLGKAMMWSNALQTGGQLLSGYAEGEALEEQLERLQPKAAWGVATEGRGGRTGPVEDYLFAGAEMPQLQGPSVAGASVPGADQVANEMAMDVAGRPYQRAMGTAIRNQPGAPMASAPPLMSPAPDPQFAQSANPGLMNWRPLQGSRYAT